MDYFQETAQAISCTACYARKSHCWKQVNTPFNSCFGVYAVVSCDHDTHMPTVGIIIVDNYVLTGRYWRVFHVPCYQP